MKRNIFYSMMGLAVVFCMMSCDGNPIKKMQATNDSLSNLTDKQQAELKAEEDFWKAGGKT